MTTYMSLTSPAPALNQNTYDTGNLFRYYFDDEYVSMWKEQRGVKASVRTYITEHRVSLVQMINSINNILNSYPNLPKKAKKGFEQSLKSLKLQACVISYIFNNDKAKAVVKYNKLKPLLQIMLDETMFDGNVEVVNFEHDPDTQGAAPIIASAGTDQASLTSADNMDYWCKFIENSLKILC